MSPGRRPVLFELGNSAYGGYAAAVGVASLPASILGGLLWEGFGGWNGFGPAAPFWFGAAMSAVAAGLLVSTAPGRSSPGQG